MTNLNIPRGTLSQRGTRGGVSFGSGRVPQSNQPTLDQVRVRDEALTRAGSTSEKIGDIISELRSHTSINFAHGHSEQPKLDEVNELKRVFQASQDRLEVPQQDKLTNERTSELLILLTNGYLSGKSDGDGVGFKQVVDYSEKLLEHLRENSPSKMAVDTPPVLTEPSSVNVPVAQASSTISTIDPQKANFLGTGFSFDKVKDIISSLQSRVSEDYTDGNSFISHDNKEELLKAMQESRPNSIALPQPSKLDYEKTCEALLAMIMPHIQTKTEPNLVLTGLLRYAHEFNKFMDKNSPSNTAISTPLDNRTPSPNNIKTEQ